MLKNQNENEESVEAILENVFGESLEISPNLKPPSQTPTTQEKTASSRKEKPAKVPQAATDMTQPAENESEKTTLFTDLPLCKEVQAAVANSGYQSPTPIQEKIIPHLLFGRDVIAQSQTGSGKTAAFALPILTRIETECNELQVLVLVPTRELAIQVGRSFEVYGANLPGFRHAVVYGGQDYEIQFRQLRKGPQVVVGTPGRIIDHINNGKLDVSEIACLVLDEADEMLNMGFLEDVQFVLDRAPDDRQIALFSATLPEPIKKISERYLNEPAKVSIKQKTLTADSIRQRAVVTAPSGRVDVLIRFLEAEEADGAIVFTRTRETTALVADKLVKAGLRASALNGEMPQKSRERTIEKLKSGQLDVLVATDIAARGLDVSRISHVFNYDLPEGPEVYTHRIGRTGRAGKKGEAIIFVSRNQQGKLRFIEKITRQKIEIVNPPSADEINKMRVKKFYNSIEQTIANRDMHFFEKLVGDFIEKSEHSTEKIAAAIAMIGQNGRDFVMKDRPARNKNELQSRTNTPFKSSKNKAGISVEPGMARFRIAVGKRDGVKPGNIVGAIAGEGGIDGADIGSIKIFHSFSTIDLPIELADQIVDSLADTRVSGRPIQIRPDDGGPRKKGGDRNRKRQRSDHRSVRKNAKKPFARAKRGPKGKAKK